MDEYNYISNSKKELESFYAPYFNSEDDLQDFLFGIFDYKNGSVKKRDMVFQVQRFISLANDIDQIRPCRDPLRILFLKIGLDSLSSLSGYTDKAKRTFYNEFSSCFSEEGRNYILNNFKLTSFQDEYNGHSFEAYHDIDLNDFLNIIKTTRDMVVHDFNYWEMQFFTYDDKDIPYITSIETKDDMIISYKYHRKKKETTTYHFVTNLKYDKFIYYFTEACVAYIKKQI